MAPALQSCCPIFSQQNLQLKFKAYLAQANKKQNLVIQHPAWLAHLTHMLE